MNNEILMKFLLKESSHEENEMVKNWLSASEENNTHFTHLEKIWKESAQLKSVVPVDTEAAWQKFKLKTEQLTPLKSTPTFKIKYTWIGIAAAFLLAIGSWIVFSMFAYTAIKSEDTVLTQHLPDGSELTFNRHSTLSYANNFKKNRNLRLEKGEVFFKVEPDRKHPFVIKIDQVDVEVIGTSFNIKHLNDTTEIVVETGVVKVSTASGVINLIKGEKVIVSGATKKIAKQQVNNQFYNYYRTKLFVANQTPLPELVVALNEAYGSHVVLDEELKRLSISITLEYGSLDDNLRYIAATLNLSVSRNQNEIRLSYQ